MSTESTRHQRSEPVDARQFDVMGDGDVNDRQLDVMAGRPGDEPKGADVMSTDDTEA